MLQPIIRYTHTKTGNTYIVIHTNVKIKLREDWVDGIVCTNGEKIYVRTKEEFESKFKLIK